MEIHRDLSKLPDFRNAVVTIGSFDGVHKGHKTIFKKIIQLAGKYNGESVVITFDPHPRSVIFPKDKSLQLLTTTDEKIEELSKLYIDHLVIVKFTVEFSQLMAEEYIENFLYRKFKPKCIVIGYDHQFGRNREGDVGMLRNYGRHLQFDVVEIEKQAVDQIAVSSTKVRNAISNAEVQQAYKLLGHYYPIRGEVIHGDKLGNQLGFPTANLMVEGNMKLIPPEGIYAAYAEYEDKQYGGMLYIGKKPTIAEGKKQSVEIHLFNFNESIYGETLTVRFVKFLRKDIKYENLNDLRLQLRKDKYESEQVLQNENLLKITEEAAKLAIVILNFKGREHLANYLPALLQYTDLGQAEIWIVDNGSEDDSIAFVEDNFPDIHTIQLDDNYGFAAGYNRALEMIDADWFVLLNNDVKVTKDWLPPLLEAVKGNDDVVAAQPKILSARQPEYFEYAGAAGGQIDNFGYPFCKGRIFETVEIDEGQYEESESIFWASGAAMLVDARIFLSAGGFDEDYFAHQEEIDLCWRIRRAGYDIKYVPESTVYHLGGGTLSYESPHKVYLNFRNNLVTLLKNEPVNRLFWLFPLRLVLDGLAAIKFLVESKPKAVSAIYKAHWHIFTHWSDIMTKRSNTADRVRRIRIRVDHDSTVGKARYPGSILFQYFFRKRKRYKQLVTT